MNYMTAAEDQKANDQNAKKQLFFIAETCFGKIFAICRHNNYLHNERNLQERNATDCFEN